MNWKLFDKLKRGTDLELIAANLIVWLFIEALMMAWHHKFIDFVGKFVEPELLIAQFIATALLFGISVVAIMRETRKKHLSCLLA